MFYAFYCTQLLKYINYCSADTIIPKYFTMQLSQTGFHVKDQSNYFSKLCALALMNNHKASACVTNHIFHNIKQFFKIMHVDLTVDLGKAGNCKVMFFLHTNLFLVYTWSFLTSYPYAVPYVSASLRFSKVFKTFQRLPSYFY